MTQKLGTTMRLFSERLEKMPLLTFLVIGSFMTKYLNKIFQNQFELVPLSAMYPLYYLVGIFQPSPLQPVFLYIYINILIFRYHKS